MSTVDFPRVNELAKKYEPEMTRFLRDMIRIPSESCQEEGVIRRIKEEMEKVGFDRVEIDKMGNVLGFIGNGPRIIAFDAHIDTVGVGNRSNWTFDPYEGYEDAETIGGRGASDQEGGMAYAPFVRKIEIEVETPEQLKEALDAGADIVMLDNMSPENMAEAVKMAKGRAETECSGNVTRENISRLIKLGVDYISSGALTHSAPILDISLKNLHPIE